jgi:hypothetical protein
LSYRRTLSVKAEAFGEMPVFRAISRDSGITGIGRPLAGTAQADHPEASRELQNRRNFRREELPADPGREL